MRGVCIVRKSGNNRFIFVKISNNRTIGSLFIYFCNLCRSSCKMPYRICFICLQNTLLDIIIKIKLQYYKYLLRNFRLL